MSLLTAEETQTLLVGLPKIRLVKELSPKQFAWRNHPSIYEWTRQNGLLSKEDHEAWEVKRLKDHSLQMFGILTEVNMGPSEDDPKDWIIREENIGTCGLTSLSPMHGTAEFSLFIGPEYQKKGYGRAALIELLRYGFHHLRLNCIWGETFQNNPALSMFLKLGMKKEGSARQRYYKNGNYIDAYWVSILEKEARRQSWFTRSFS